MFYTIFNSSLCEILIAGNNNGLKKLYLNFNNKSLLQPDLQWLRKDSFFTDTIKQLSDYFSGNIKKFNIPIAPDGTEFQKKVWNSLINIPYGKTKSYKQIAIETGNPYAARAVGMANNKNPLPIIIPCHRVIGQNGNLKGFAYGLNIKKQLLQLEAAYLL